jgi:hypothetical protein
MEIDEPIEFCNGDKIKMDNKEYTILSINIETYDNGNITRYLALITQDINENAKCIVIQHIVYGKTRLFVEF